MAGRRALGERGGSWRIRVEMGGDGWQGEEGVGQVREGGRIEHREKRSISDSTLFRRQPWKQMMVTFNMFASMS